MPRHPELDLLSPGHWMSPEDTLLWESPWQAGAAAVAADRERALDDTYFDSSGCKNQELKANFLQLKIPVLVPKPILVHHAE